MKRIFSFLIALTLIPSCKTDDIKPKDIVSVNEIPSIRVLFGTQYKDLPLPLTVSVAYSNNTSEEVAINYSSGNYNNIVADTYTIEGVLKLGKGVTNTKDLKASVSITVIRPRLKTVKQDNVLLYEYFYDTILNRLDHFHVQANNTDYYYTYASPTDNKVIERVRKLPGNNYPEKYYYTGNALDSVEFYYDETILDQTHRYTYTNGRITRLDNSDQSVNTLKYRTFEYDTEGNVSKVSFDFGNPWNYTYVNDKNVSAPLILDPADPLNQIIFPVATFSFVTTSTYESQYIYNVWGYPIKEVRTYTENGNTTSTLTYTYK